MKLMIDEYNTLALNYVIGTLDVMIDMCSYRPTEEHTIQMSTESLVNTLVMIKEQLEHLKNDFKPMS